MKESMKRIKGLSWSSLVWSKKQIKKMLIKKILVLIFEMLVGMVKVIVLLIIALFLGGGKRPPFIPLLSEFSALANFGTDL